MQRRIHAFTVQEFTVRVSYCSLDCSIKRTMNVKTRGFHSLAATCMLDGVICYWPTVHVCADVQDEKH